MKKIIMSVLAGLFVMQAQAGGNDDPLLSSLYVEQVEWREDDEVVWDAEGWIGKDRDKLWFKTEGEWTSDATEEFETQVLWHRAISPFWNLETGWRGDWQPETRRSWFAFGVSGLAPGFIETQLTAFVADGRSAARLKASHEAVLTQRWVLVPKLEIDWYSDTDERNEIGDGVSELELSVRLHYRVRPDLLPYVGIAYTALYGETGDFAEAEGERDRNLQVLAGLSFWF